MQMNFGSGMRVNVSTNLCVGVFTRAAKVSLNTCVLARERIPAKRQNKSHACDLTYVRRKVLCHV